MSNNGDAGSAIQNALNRNKLNAKDVESKKIMTRKTFYKKLKEPRLFSLDEIWKLDRLLGFNEYEWQLIKKGA